eukprot:TRINITY_DN50691_c0_g1_i1.p1 TRINITY_DN50691_c0_g1~~TRINITY_DN50691_c0_g1_i1.p1  ORF type:complete len:180 (-),score=56.22 TRINITY_DN50691_c0_g1_i1:179-718(-)
MFFCCASQGGDADVVQPLSNADDQKTAQAEADNLAEMKKMAEQQKAQKDAEEAAKQAADEAAAQKATDEAAAQKDVKEAPAEKAVEKVIEYTVELEMDTAMTTVGLELRQPSCKVKSVRDDGLVPRHNKSNASNKVEVGDRLISVNGCAKGEVMNKVREFYSSSTPPGARMQLKFARKV